jgi:broad specificity phosphatase PhoE
MNTSEVILIRHGNTDKYNDKGEQVVYGPSQPLEPSGKIQIQMLGCALGQRVQPDILITSPTLRALQSAVYLSDALPNHPNIQVHEGLRASAIPQWDDRPVRELAEVGGNMFRANPNVPDVYGEHIEDVYKRATEAFAHIRSQYGDQVVGIVTHGEIIGMIQHAVHHGADSQPGIEESINKGEAVVFQFNPEGALVHEQKISGEYISNHPER